MDSRCTVCSLAFWTKLWLYNLIFWIKEIDPHQKVLLCCTFLPPLAKSIYSRETQLLIPLLVPRWPASVHGLFFLFQQKTGSAAGICCLFNILLHPALSAKAIVAHFFFFPLAFAWFNHKVGQSCLNGACFCSVLHCFVDFGARLQ